MVGIVGHLAGPWAVRRQFAMENGFGDLLEEVFGSDPEGSVGWGMFREQENGRPGCFWLVEDGLDACGGMV